MRTPRKKQRSFALWPGQVATSDPQTRQVLRGWFALPLAPGHSRTEVNQPVCHPSMANLVICHLQSPVVQDPTQFPDAAMAFPPPPPPQPQLREEREGGGGTHTQSLSGTRKAEQGGKVKCNAFSGTPAVWGCSKLPPQPVAMWCKLVFRQPSCRGDG